MRSSHGGLPTILAGFLMLTASVAYAEVSVQGTPEALHVEAKSATVGQVLGALRDTYGLTYQSEIPLGRQVSGTYVGPLPQVLARLLEGTNFVLTHSGNNVQVVITSSAGPQPIAPPSGMPFPMPELKPNPTPQMPPGLVIPPPPPPTPSARRDQGPR